MLVWLALIAIGLAAPVLTRAAETARGTAIILDIDGAIGPASADFLARGLNEAAQREAAIVVLRMDTPGGLDTSMRDIIRAILASPVPVATYVAPSGARAASAGTYIIYASHIAAMAPGTNLGAATPVTIGGLPFPGQERDKPPERKTDDEKKDGESAETREETKRAPDGAREAKLINDAVAYIRALAEMRGRNADWAETAVREAASLSAAAALERNVIDIMARNVDDLLDQADGRTVSVAGRDMTLRTAGLATERIEPDWRTRLLGTITNPNIALILMMIGIYGLFFEFLNPGSLYPGTIGAISLLVGLYALAALPVSYAGLALILLGIALMTAEAFAPSFGILGIGGVIAFIIGAAILIDTDDPAFAISWAVIGAVAAAALVFTLILVPLALRAYRRTVVTGREQLIGASGEVRDWRGGRGHVFVLGERWNARSANALKSGQAIRVTEVDGLTLTVEPVAERPD